MLYYPGGSIELLKNALISGKELDVSTTFLETLKINFHWFLGHQSQTLGTE